MIKKYNRSRPVTVKVNEVEGYITFHFTDESDYEFYDIAIEDWIIPERNWEKHMMRKSWFSGDMGIFINDCIKSIKNGYGDS